MDRSRTSVLKPMKTGALKAGESFVEDGDEWLSNLVKAVNRKIQGWKERMGTKEAASVQDKKMAQWMEVVSMVQGIEKDEPPDEDVHWTERGSFDIVMSAVILLNTLVIGLETDLNTAGRGKRAWIWILLEALFVTIFGLEIFFKLREAGRGPKVPDGEPRPWKFNVAVRWFFDFLNMATTIIFVMAFIDIVILLPLSQSGVAGSSGTLRLVSLVRVIGLVRLARVVRLYKFLQEMRLVLDGFATAMQTIVWVVLLLLLILYVCGVIATKAIGRDTETYGQYMKVSGGWDHEEHFGTVGRSMFTLLQCVTLDRWLSTIVRHVINNQWYLGPVFLVFLMFTAFGLLNVVVSVIVENTLVSASKNAKRNETKIRRAKKKELESIEEIFQAVDTDGSGILELAEFLEAIEKPEVKWRMRQMELPVAECASLFDSMDKDGNRSLSIDEFKRGCAKLKGPATAKDIVGLMAQKDSLSENVTAIGEALEESKRMMDALDTITSRLTRRFGSAVLGSRVNIASRVGGAQPVVPPPRLRNGAQKQGDLSIGNRPALPTFPSLLK